MRLSFAENHGHAPRRVLRILSILTNRVIFHNPTNAPHFTCSRQFGQYFAIVFLKKRENER